MRRKLEDGAAAQGRYRLRDALFASRDAADPHQRARSDVCVIVSARDGHDWRQSALARIRRAPASARQPAVKRGGRRDGASSPEPFHNPFRSLRDKLGPAPTTETAATVEAAPA